MTTRTLQSEADIQEVYFFSEIWWGIYLGSAIAVSVLLLIFVLFPLGISVASDAVFGVLALVSGVLVELVFFKAFKRKMMISEKIHYSILYVWIPLCLYVIVVRPFE